MQSFRVNEETFSYICDLVRPQLEPIGNNFRKPLPVDVQVAIALYSLGHGLEYTPLMNQFGVARSTAHKVVTNFNRALWARKEEFIRWRNLPGTMQKFKEWGFPMCVGAIDGCHIPIQRPPRVGAAYRNYKNFHSIVVQAVVDENRFFCDVDIGNPGINHDAHIYRTSELYIFAQSNFGLGAAFNRRVNVGGVWHRIWPYLIGDPAYPISRWLIKGWSRAKCGQEKKCGYFTHRLSSVRMRVEQAFGMLKARWHRLATPHKAKLRYHVEAIGAALVLHNICLEKMGKKGISQNLHLTFPFLGRFVRILRFPRHPFAKVLFYDPQTIPYFYHSIMKHYKVGDSVKEGP